jgi:flavin-dependent thymidylate synthase
MTREVQRWADVSMYKAIPIADELTPVMPTVHLVSMTDNPLRTMAAAAELYAGKHIFDPGSVSKKTAIDWFRDMTKTRLQAPLEFIDLHFILRGVTRAFTHQLVRQRTAVYVQESQRFAVKENAINEVALPPSLWGKAEDHPWRVLWDQAIASVSATYNGLVDNGMPAEDARGLLPTNITTTVHYKTNLRNLAEHAGNRLCTQAQYEWRQVWAGIISAIRSYGPIEERWQQHLIASIFKPICYTTGKCEFMADTDRYCAIRERVQEHAAHSTPPSEWDNIAAREWMADPASARLAPKEADL